MSTAEKSCRWLALAIMCLVAGFVAYKAPAYGNSIALPLIGAVVFLAGMAKPPHDGGSGPVGPTALFVLLASMLGEPPTGCTKQQAATAIDLGGQGACALLVAVLDTGTVKTICAVEPEIAQIIKWILSARGDAGPPAAAAKCTVVAVTGLSVCASGPELAAAIDRMNASRSALFVRDAGP